MSDRLHKILSDWRSRARAEAAEQTHHATKQAVREVKMSEAEQAAAHALYRSHKSVSRRICEAALSKARQSPEQPPLSLPDLMQEGYVLLLRCLVGYNPDKGSLSTYLKHALRSRITDYLRSRSETQVPSERERVRPSREARLPARTSALPTTIDPAGLATALFEEGAFAETERARQIWSQLCPEASPQGK